jgi:hypothetical protein
MVQKDERGVAVRLDDLESKAWPSWRKAHLAMLMHSTYSGPGDKEDQIGA